MRCNESSDETHEGKPENNFIMTSNISEVHIG
jgi:hypothetical protein